MGILEQPADGNLKAIGVGVLGYGSMGRAHSAAFVRLRHAFWPPLLEPRLIAVAARDEGKVSDLASRFGYTTWYTRWQDMVADSRIQLFDNTGPNYMHAEPCIAAAKAGMHVLCEKPLARNTEEARTMLAAVQAAGVTHMVGFNYRFLPAVRLAKQILEEGRLGKIVHFRARYLQSSLADPSFPYRWRSNRDLAGAGVLGDLGSHIVDLARFLVGEPVHVSGSTSIFIDRRPVEGDPSRTAEVTSDDAFHAVVEYENGATGVLEASKMCLGSPNRLEFEVNGVDGSLRFSLERLDELQVYLRKDEDSRLAGFRSVDVTGADHPFMAHWWPRHPLGWDQTFVHSVAHMMSAIAGEGTIEPYGATFEDGYKAVVVCDAIAASAERGTRVRIDYGLSANAQTARD